MENLKNTIYELSQQINAAGTDYTVMTIFYPNAVAVYIYYGDTCEFTDTLIERLPSDYWYSVIDVLKKYRDETAKERSVA